MGILYHEQEFDDDYSRDIIARIRDLSPELDDYVVTEKYLLETQPENLTPLWLRNRLLVKTIDQLTDRGIFLNQDTDDALDAPILVDAIITLRAKFDDDRLYAFLVKHQAIRDELNELLDDDCLTDVIACCARNVPLDEGWESLNTLINNRPGILRSTKEFNDLILKTFERCDRLGDNEVVPEDDMDKMLSYVKFLGERKSKILSIAQTIYSADDHGTPNEDKKELVAEVMQTFEKQLSHPRALRQFVDEEFTPKSFIEKLRSFYVSTWNHCFEYYITADHQQVIPSDLEMAILVATLYVDAPDPDHARVHVVEVFENLIDQLGDRYNLFREIIDRILGNIIIVEGGMNNAIK